MTTFPSERQIGADHDDSLAMSLPGPSRTIIVEPIERPERPAPAEPEPQVEPEHTPEPAAPDRVPEKVPE